MKNSMVSLSRLLRTASSGLIAGGALLFATHSEAQTSPAVPSSPISGGGSHTCMRTPAGGVKCWGDNGLGQLGDGTFVASPTPVDVVGLTSGVAAIATGRVHSCALTTGGAVKCWGSNFSGQLGDGSNTGGNPGGSPRNIPVDVAGLDTNVRSIAAGRAFTCAVDGRGDARCWGDNTNGELGNGVPGNSSVPVRLALGISGGSVSAIYAGDDHACAIFILITTSPRTTRCWGSNASGQFGDGTTNNSNVPITTQLVGAVTLALGLQHGCARLANGGLQCWGSNLSGQLGDGTTVRKLLPVNVIGLGAGAVDIAAGRFHTCARTVSGAVKCWGFNGYGQVGDATFGDKSAPTQVAGLTNDAIGIGAGGLHSCALNAATAQCWGENFLGQLGNGGGADAPFPTKVIGSEFTETFPPGGQLPVGWLTTPGATAGWVVDAGTTATGILSLRSAPIGNNAFACTQFTATMGSGDITFQRRVSSDTADQFRVVLDDLLVPSTLASGNLPWQNVSIPVTAGSHVVAFCYSKNTSDFAFADAAWIDDVSFPSVLPPLALSAVVSRKLHGTSGLYDLAIDPLIPIAGLVTVESRVIGSGHDIIFQFDGPATSVGTVTAVDAAANAVGAATAAVSGNDVIVTLTGVADNRRLTVAITDVNGAGVNASVSIGFLVGDVNNTGSVNSSDISGVKARSGQSTDASNFKFDVNASGAINSSDISAVKARSGLTMPP